MGHRQPSPWTPPNRSWPPTPRALTDKGYSRRRAPLVSRPPAGRRRLCHRHHRLDPGPGGHRTCAATRPGTRALSGSAEELAGRPEPGVSGPGRAGGNGRLRRLQNRRGRRSARRDRSDGSPPRRRIGRGQARPVPTAHPTTDVRAPRPNRRSPLPGPAHPAHPIPAAQTIVERLVWKPFSPTSPTSPSNCAGASTNASSWPTPTPTLAAARP